MNRILIFVILCVGLFQSCTKQETITYQAQFKIDTELVDSFVKNSNTDAVKVNTGFWYSIDTLRNGIYPTFSDSVKISYSIKWIEPTSTNESDLKTVGYSASSTVLLSKAISGLQQALILFPAGSYGRIYLPSGLAFGSSEHSYPNDTPQINIPVNANLLYEIKLIGVKGTRFASDTTDIGNYLRANTIKSLKDVSGIRYTINTAGQTSSAKPTQEDSVIVTYTENVFKAPDTAKVNLKKKIAWKDQTTGWRIMLPQYATQGSRITMYTPSSYAYGSSVKGSIQANSNLTYVVTLDSVIHH